MKKLNLLLTVLCSTLLFACENTTSSSNQNSSNTSLNTTLSATSEIRETETLEIDFTNDQSAVDLSENSTEYQRVVSLFGNYLDTMQITKVFEDIGVIKLGSGSASGNWTLNFNKKVSSITVEARSYTKYIDYSQSYQIDQPVFVINEENMSIDIPEETDSTFQEYEKYFVEPSLSVVLESNAISGNVKGRILLKSMKIDFLKY